jgi:hypothetical protein
MWCWLQEVGQVATYLTRLQENFARQKIGLAPLSIRPRSLSSHQPCWMLDHSFSITITLTDPYHSRH